MKSMRYRHLENSKIDEGVEDVQPEIVDRDVSDDSDKKKTELKKCSPFSFENVGWIIAAIAVIYYTDFFNTLLHDERIETSWLHATIFCGAVLMFVSTYLIFYLYMFKHIDPDDWDKLYPFAIPCASASTVLFGICMTVTAWPVWGVLTLPILFIILMAFICGVCMLDIFKVLCRRYDGDECE